MNKELRIKNYGKRFINRLIHNLYSMICNESGQSLMEIMIALAVGAILIGGASIAVVVILQSGSTNQINQSATVLAQEIVEKGRIYGTADWSNLYELEKSSSTKYFFNTSSTEIFHIEGVEGIIDGDIKEGLVGHWKLDEATSDTAYDFSGEGNHGSTNGAVATSTDYCQLGQCYYFNGSGNYVRSNNSINLDSSFTISFWMNITNLHDYGDPFSLGINDMWLTFVTYNDGHMFYNIGDGNNWGNEINPGAGTFLENVWYHVTGTYDGSNTELYVDGKSQGTALNNGYSFNKVVNIGARTSNNYYHEGYLDDVRIYNRALSANEIEHLYNSTFFDRYFYVDNACRTNDANYSLAGAAPCDAGEVEDPSTQLFTGVVEWAGKEGESSFALSEYITRWRNDVFHQTDWSGGSGDDGPVSNSSDSYSSSTDIDFSNLGEIRIEGL